MARQWIYDNLNVDDYWMGYDVIDWGNHYFTEIDGFVRLFGEVIEMAIADEKDVIQELIKTEHGKSFKDLLLN